MAESSRGSAGWQSPEPAWVQLVMVAGTPFMLMCRTRLRVRCQRGAGSPPRRSRMVVHQAGIPYCRLSAEDPLQVQGGVQGATGGLGLLRRHAEPVVESGQEVPQHGVGLVDGGSVRQPEFADLPVLEGAGHAFHPSLRLW